MTVSKLTKEQAAIIGVYTGVSCGPFSGIHELAEKLLNRPILTHEMAFPEIWKELREKVKPQFWRFAMNRNPDPDWRDERDAEDDEIPERDDELPPSNTFN